MKRFRALALLIVVSLPWQVFSRDTPASDVQLMHTGEELRPSTTLEFRFARPMISAEAVGPTLESPVVIEPAWPGTFTWLSTRSGVYVPEAAPPLGTAFVVTVRDGLTDLEGRPIGSTFSTTLRTPPFSGVSFDTGDPDTPISPLPDVRLLFNQKIDLAASGDVFHFQNDAGDRVPATVRHGTINDYFPSRSDTGDWDRRWAEARHAIEASAPPAEAGDPDKPLPILDRLVVTPAVPLSTRGLWQLEMQPGLVAMKSAARVEDFDSIVLGKVRPFTVTRTMTESYVNSGRSLTLEFSAGLAPDIDSESADSFFQVTPAVDNLRFEQNYSALVIRGDFQLEQEYVLTASPGVVSSEGQALEGDREFPFVFQPVSPRLYLPLITGHQIRGGLRKLAVSTVNLESMDVKVFQVPAEEVTRSFNSFDDYPKTDWDENAPDEQFQPLPPDAFTRELVSTTTVAFAAPLDARRDVSLDWDELARGREAGALFVSVEGKPRDEIGGPHPAAQALVLLTDLGVLWKKTGADLRTHVFSLASGQPLEGVAVRLETADNRVSPPVTTDSTGTVTMPIPSMPAWLTAQLGEDMQAVRVGEHAKDLPTAAFQVPTDFGGWEESEEEEPRQWMLFTDRPLYRPGDVVRIKGYVRQRDDNAWVARPLEAETISMRNAKWESVFEGKIAPNARGAFDTEITLPPAGVGAHYVSIGNGSTSFHVAEYQPNAFAVTAESPSRFAPDAPVELAVSGIYFFGAPLSDATVRWTLQLRPGYFSPEGFDEFEFGGVHDDARKSLALRGETEINDGALSFIRPQVPTPSHLPNRGTWTVEVTDLNQQTVTETRTFQHDAAAFYLGVSTPSQSFVESGTEIPLQIVAVKPDGQPLDTAVPVHAELIRVDYQTVRVQGAGGAIAFRSERIEEAVASYDGTSLLPERAADQWTVNDGETLRVTASRAGSYRVQVSAVDQAGRTTRTDWSFYVAGPGETVWDYRTPAQIDLVPDKAEYRPGETARLMVKTPIEGDALLTVEQDDQILRSEKVSLTGNAPVVDVPIAASDAPNIFVSLLLLRGLEDSPRDIKMPEYRHGLVMLSVRDPAKALQVEVKPESSEVRPGAELAVGVLVRDGMGRPMRDAEVTLFAVDDGILAITGYERPHPGEAFHRPQPLRVRTGLSLSDLLPEDEDMLTFGNKGYLIGGGGADGPGPELRRDFPGTAAWFPSLRTDAEGRVAVRIAAPDALTRYRLVAVAHAGDDFFGSGESSFVIRKTLMVLPSIGQFANEGDTLLARAVVRNETATAGEVSLALTTDNLAEVMNGNRKTIRLQPHQAGAVDFELRFAGTGTSHWEWHARLESASEVAEDRVASEIEVGSPSVLLREIYLSTLDAETNALIGEVNPQLLEGTGTLSLTLSNTRLASLRETVHHLRDYPYACGEQTVSRLVPLLVWDTLRPVLPELDLDPEKETAEMIARLFAMQTPSGGLSWWPGQHEPSLFVSAYAAVALARRENTGSALPSGRERLTDWLSEQLRTESTRPSPDSEFDRTLALYALALSGKAEPAYHETLFQIRADLTHETRALLALAIIESGGGDAMVETLLDPDVAAPESWSVIGGAGRERALRLLAFSRWKPESKEIAPVVMELLASRRQGHWQTTQDNAWALMALAEMFERVEKGGQPVAGVLVTDDESDAFHLTRETPVWTKTFDLTPDPPFPKLAVRNPDRLPLFGEARFTVRPPLGDQPRQDRGFAVSRAYQKIGPDGIPAPAADLRVGDRVLVTLRIESKRPTHFVAIDDPLPAVLEAIHPDFRGQDGGFYWSSSHREMRADRVIIYCDQLPAGAFTFHYQARVRAAGAVSAPATKVEEMYRPEHFGLGASERLTSHSN